MRYNYRMKRASIGEAQHNFGELIRQVAAGEEIEITRHKRVVARLVPAGSGDAAEYPDFAGRAEKIFAQSAGSPASEIVLQDRDERA